MDILDDLLCKSEKELQEILVENIYKSKYILDKKNISVISKVQKVQNAFLVNHNIISSTIYSHNEFLDKFIPFTIKTFNEIKKKNILKTIQKLSISDLKILFSKWFLKVYSEHLLEIIIFEDRELNIIVHYPEIKIKNSIEIEHTIKDFFIRFSFEKKEAFVHLSNITGMRTTFTDIEYFNAYAFSHLNGGMGKESDTFCFGDNEYIGKKVSQLKKGNFSNFVEFLYLFDSYLHWESIEGTPYHPIEKLRNFSLFDEVAAPFFSINFLDIMSYFSQDNFNIIYDINDDFDVYITLTEQTKNFIDNLLTIHFPQYVYFYKDGKSIDILKKVQELPEVFRKDIMMFKKTSFDFRIIKSEIDTSNMERRIHRNILNSILHEIETYLQNFVIYKLNKELL